MCVKAHSGEWGEQSPEPRSDVSRRVPFMTPAGGSVWLAGCWEQVALQSRRPVARGLPVLLQ